MNIPFLAIALLSVLSAQPAAASDFTFMRPCARANALGTAFSTVDKDACAVFYNPGNLTTLESMDVKLETGRRLAPGSSEGEIAVAYTRPVPDTRNKVAGLGYYSARQTGGFALDSAVFSLGDRAVIKYMQKPLYYGGGVKIMSLRTREKSHLGLGVEAGARIENSAGYRTALALTDAVFGLGRSLMTVTLGNSYTITDTTLLMDLKTRGTYSEVFFGIEHVLFAGLAQIRAGKGISLGGGKYLATGLGVNLLPWTMDFTWGLPWAGYGENSGYYGFTIGYRFGSGTYSEKLVGDASRKAESLKTQIDDLRVQRSNLENSISTYKVNKSMLETELTLMQTRMREMENNLKELQVDVLREQYRKENPKPIKKYAPPPAERWPKEHRVAAGDTLRSISAKYYGTPNFWERIYEANEKKVLKGLPMEGALLVIPPPAERK